VRVIAEDDEASHQRDEAAGDRWRLRRRALGGNVQPVAADRVAEAITCALPMNTPGLALWSRKSFEPRRERSSTIRCPIASTRATASSSSTPSGAVAPGVLHGDAPLSRDIYIKTPSTPSQPSGENVRFWAKLELLVGLASKDSPPPAI